MYLPVWLVGDAVVNPRAAFANITPIAAFAAFVDGLPTTTWLTVDW
jgi:hypothetical protein